MNNKFVHVVSEITEKSLVSARKLLVGFEIRQKSLGELKSF